jgi:hypothetical protein
MITFCFFSECVVKQCSSIVQQKTQAHSTEQFTHLKADFTQNSSLYCSEEVTSSIALTQTRFQLSEFELIEFCFVKSSVRS